MTPDPKWLEILKASGWQTTAVAAACAIIYTLVRLTLLPDPGPLVLVFIAGAGIVCGCLALASILSAVAKAIPLGRWWTSWWKRQRSIRSIRSYLPHLTEEDRAILGYLLHHNQKTFTGATDGGYAAALISRGFVVMALRPGQVFDTEETPFAIPDLVWDELMRIRDQFPTPPAEGIHPWRVHWMVRR